MGVVESKRAAQPAASVPPADKEITVANATAFLQAAEAIGSVLMLPEGVEKVCQRSFRGTGLRALVLPRSVRELGRGAFADCVQLSRVDFSEGLEKIEPSCFAGTDLREIALPASLRELGAQAFYGCAKLVTVKFAEGLEKIGDQCF